MLCRKFALIEAEIIIQEILIDRFQLMLNLVELENNISYNGNVYITVSDRTLEFDLSNVHERRYFSWYIFGVMYPQAEIDRRIFQNFTMEGDICLDIGANIGVTSVEMLAAGAGKVFAFEPVRELNKRLSKLSDPNIEVVNFAVSDKTQVSNIILSRAHNQGHTLVRRQVDLFPTVFGEERVLEKVYTVSLDDYFYKDGETSSAGDLWKIDVEGAELDVLVGARRLLENCPPRFITCECYEGAENLISNLVGNWEGYRATLSKDDDELVLGSLDWVPSPSSYHVISPTYVFLNSDKMVLPMGIRTI